MNTNTRRNSLLWNVAYKNNRLLLGGTIHLAFPEYQQICKRFVSAAQTFGAEQYFGETNLDDMRRSMPHISSRSLISHFTKKSFHRYQEKLLYMLNINLFDVQLMSPMMISSLISAKLVGFHGSSIDEVLWQNAVNNDIPTDGLESFDRQLEIYDQISETYQLYQLKQLLRNLTKSRKSLLELIQLYKTQQIHELGRRSRKSLGEIRHLMLHERNQRMSEKIYSLLISDVPRSFATVGAAHLSGQFGILHHLTQRGCNISPVF